MLLTFVEPTSTTHTQLHSQHLFYSLVWCLFLECVEASPPTTPIDGVMANTSICQMLTGAIKVAHPPPLLPPFFLFYHHPYDVPGTMPDAFGIKISFFADRLLCSL